MQLICSIILQFWLGFSKILFIKLLPLSMQLLICFQLNQLSYEEIILQQWKSTPGITFHLDFKIKIGLKFYNRKFSF